ncbi:hypothetical protein FSP39_015393 [Pinctada imbricata]|uniref:Transporter n=1 Tax=Pinctada imbricata TaxID=66713 RepID=A0AA88YRI6_PINIB|nr:hypothetical protein FSP39_015393 [Pinctada imbricata]
MELEPLKSDKEELPQLEVNSEAEREKWGRKVEFLLSVCGFAVGPGNLWRFPYICMRNGGGAFLIPFIILLFTLGLPLFFVEVSLGQFSGKGIYGVWNICPIFKGIGVGMGIADIVVTAYFATVLPWTMYYFGNAFINPIPWSLCNQDWNTDNCKTERSGKYLYHFNVTLNASNPWTNNTLNISAVDRNMTEKIPFVSSEEEFLQGITLPGSLDGILFYIKPDFNRILSSQVWMEAAIQIFYSSGIIWGPLITFASFNKFNNNCLRDSIFLICVGEGTSIFGGFVVFSILGYMAHKVNVPIETVVKSGPGLGYIAYPEAVMELPLPNLWSVLFFLMLFTLTLDGVV